MTVTVQSIVDRVQTTLQDTTGIRWPVVDELVLWVNDAQREVALIKPDAAAMNETIPLVAGTKQSIPALGNRLLRVVRNMSSAAASATGGRSIRIVDRDILDANTPTWHDPTVTGDAAHGTTCKHYIYDEANPRNFYVYPGVSGNAFIEIIYSKNPVQVTLSDSLSIPAIYANAIVDYTLFRAYTKDAEFAANANRANTHYQLFMVAVTGKGQLDVINSPNFDRDELTKRPQVAQQQRQR